MSDNDFTKLIKAKGWKIKDALEYWGRGQDWYADNRKGDEFAQRRLKCMIGGLEVRPSRINLGGFSVSDAAKGFANLAEAMRKEPIQQWDEFGLPIIQDRNVPPMPKCKPPKQESPSMVDTLINKVDKLITKIEGAGR